jgi:hypothetical protein
MSFIKQKLDKLKLKLALLVVITLALPFISTVPAFATIVPSEPNGTAPPSVSSPSQSCNAGTGSADQDSFSCPDSAINCSSDKCDFVGTYVNPTIQVLSALFGVVAVISLIMGGIQYSSSGGDPQKVSNAKKRIGNTIISIFAFLFLYSFLQFLIPGGIFNR